MTSLIAELRCLSAQPVVPKAKLSFYIKAKTQHGASPTQNLTSWKPLITGLVYRKCTVIAPKITSLLVREDLYQKHTL